MNNLSSRINFIRRIAVFKSAAWAFNFSRASAADHLQITIFLWIKTGPFGRKPINANRICSGPNSLQMNVELKMPFAVLCAHALSVFCCCCVLLEAHVLTSTCFYTAVRCIPLLLHNSSTYTTHEKWPHKCIIKKKMRACCVLTKP